VRPWLWEVTLRVKRRLVRTFSPTPQQANRATLSRQTSRCRQESVTTAKPRDPTGPNFPSVQEIFARCTVE
jgi:hypothetical protein